MAKDFIIVIGGSAGAIEAVQEIISHLPVEIPAAIFVVIHFPPQSISYLADILNRRGTLPAHLAENGEAILPGHIYVAVPDYHLRIEPGTVQLTREARENHNRPAIDLLFRSAAESYGSCVTGVVLSGLLNDGTAGLIEIKAHGGNTIVQDPATALFGDMPQSVINNMPDVDYILPPRDIASRLVQLIDNPHGATSIVQTLEKGPHRVRLSAQERDLEMAKDEVHAAKVVAANTLAQENGERNELPSIYSCPECGGVLWQMDEKGFIRFRCHVGHTFSGEVLLQQQSEVLESSIWYALRTMIDKAKLARQLALKAAERGHETSAAHFEAQARAAEHHARVINQLIERNGEPPMLSSPAERTVE